VLRGGLTPKHIDVPELLSVLDTTPGEVPVLRPSADDAVTAYPVPVPDFALRRARIDGELSIDVSGPAIVLATAGEVQVTTDAEGLVVPVGAAVFASADERTLVLRGTGEAFIAEPGVSTP
jgi:mannose-6-phosphate isomerase